MKFSIRTKLTSAVVFLITVFFLATVAMSYFGLEGFYIWERKQSLAALGREISETYIGDPDNGLSRIEQISREMGMIVIIMDENHNLTYASYPGARNQRTPDRRRSAFTEVPPALLDSSDLSTPTVVLRNDRPHDRNAEIVLIQGLPDNHFLIIKQPLAPIRETISIALIYMSISGLICLAIGVILAFYFTNRLTRPLYRLKDIALTMSHLDFSRKWTDVRQDEIGLLGTTLNHLSDELDQTIQKLHTSNELLEKELTKARSLDEMRTSFISDVSHELKTPLALIQGYAEGLADETVAHDEATRQKYTSIIINETIKMDKLVKDLLNLSQIESQAFTLNYHHFDLRELILDMTAAFTHHINEKDIHLSCTLPPTMPAYGDETRVNQVLTNIVTNAIDYTNSGGSLEIKAEDIGSSYKISVFNEGPTIPAEDLEKIWTPFHKVDKSRKRSRTFGGHGIGLSIVRALQESQHQQYGVYNQDKGVVFWITVAKKPESEQNEV